VLFITHDLSLGNYVSDQTILLRHGAIVEMGETEKVFGNPRHEYTRMLLSAVPELHRKWQHAPPGPDRVPVGAGAALPGAVNADSAADASAATLTQASLLDEMTHAEQVVKRDLRAVLGARRAAASGRSQVAVALEPPVLREFEPGHLVADPE
jgi:ABC-type glutathione transport system ATPase component